MWQQPIFLTRHHRHSIHPYLIRHQIYHYAPHFVRVPLHYQCHLVASTPHKHTALFRLVIRQNRRHCTEGHEAQTSEANHKK
jgi:hypothetical protein